MNSTLRWNLRTIKRNQSLSSCVARSPPLCVLLSAHMHFTCNLSGNNAPGYKVWSQEVEKFIRLKTHKHYVIVFKLSLLTLISLTLGQGHQNWYESVKLLSMEVIIMQFCKILQAYSLWEKKPSHIYKFLPWTDGRTHKLSSLHGLTSHDFSCGLDVKSLLARWTLIITDHIVHASQNEKKVHTKNQDGHAI